MDSVCLRSASTVWSVPGKCGPHGELFFLQIQKELVTLPGSETFSLFFNADIRTPLFSADVLKKRALIALHVIAEEEETEKLDVVPWSGERMENGLPKESNVGR